MEKIQPINLGCSGLTRTLPLAFDESMSYVELLYAMNDKLTEAINDLNIIIEDYSNIEANFDEVYSRLTALNTDIINLKQYTDTLVSAEAQELRTYTNTVVNNAITGIEADIDNMYDELNTKINNISVGQVDVYNPTTGQVENIDKVIVDIYNANRLYAITCTGFDSLELTATEFDSKELTAYDFDNYSLELLTN